MRRLLPLWILIGLLLLPASVSSSGTALTILVDNVPIQTDVPPRIENGRTLVPVRTLSEALGLEVSWIPDRGAGAQVLVGTYPRVFDPAPGEGRGMDYRSQPTDMNALAAGATLTQYLATEQVASLSGDGPAMVRFELIDTRSLCRFPPPSDMREFCANGFRFAVRTYYVELLESVVSPTVAQYQRVSTEGGTSIQSVGKDVHRSWYVDATIDVRPIGVEGEADVATFGTNGWTVDWSSRTILQTVQLEGSPYLIHGSFAR